MGRRLARMKQGQRPWPEACSTVSNVLSPASAEVGTAALSRRPYALSFPGPPPMIYQDRVGGIAVAVATLAYTTDSHSETQRLPTDQVPLPATQFAVV